MNHLKLIILSAICLGTFAVAPSASAQSLRHDRMDARATREDMERLKADRRRALRHHDWGKVAQDDRLIEADRRFLRQDIHKLRDRY